MQTGDIVAVRVHGRVYYARVMATTSRTAHIEFCTIVPPMDGRRRRRRSLSLARCEPYGRMGVDWIHKGAA